MSYQNYSRHRTGSRSYKKATPQFSSKGYGRQQPSKGNNYIHPSRFVNHVRVVEEKDLFEPQHTFADFNFTGDLYQNIERKSYSTPSAIQDQAIPYIMANRDVIGLANTGTGKTAAFLLPIVHRLSERRTQMSVLIIAPTRELAQQIDEEFRVFSYGMRLYSTLCVGGANIERQVRDLRRRPHVIIGTPGRLMDLIKKGELSLSVIRTLVLDEADRMLDMGFIADIRRIVALIPADRQTLFFSATMTPSIQQLTQGFLRDPKTVSVRTSDTSDHVEQDVVEADSKEKKLALLTEMLRRNEFEKVLLFGQTKHGVQRLSDYLEKNGFNAAAIHGNKSQSQRQHVLQAFRDNRLRVLVATDVAARGLDIPNVSHVINFDQPATYEDYVHRIGRTGRGNATGKALTFVDPPEVRRALGPVR